ncbi:MAG: ADP-glyceromanno-heptose 6-epimerase [Chitinispirillaceae bacterium]|nr:ADP-glyceromanno-heptose 6-epimerase [Chitinispirillaceae bacterium]
MIVVTGGAGFIGSALVWKLNQRGIDDIVIVDRLGSAEKWRNLVALRYSMFYEKYEFLDKLESGFFGDSIDTIFHLGACSATTEKDADYLMNNNIHYTIRIGTWWENHQDTRLIYASSAATYGDGEKGYKDDISGLDDLRPLNMYGYSKHFFDLYARRKGWLKKIVGLKFFNVFGPNEYHKNSMRSVINKAWPDVRDSGKISLFKSYNPLYADGDQLRDFIYIKDALEMTLFFFDNRNTGGIFNIGTGKAQTWNDCAKAIFSATGKKPLIEYISMPEELKGKYQYFTQADLQHLRQAGCNHNCMPLNDAVADYVQNYLIPQRYLGD